MAAKTLGQKIRQLRLAKGMSQEDLAIGLDVNQRSVSVYETDKVVPSMEKLEKLALIFDVEPNYFFPTYVTKRAQQARQEEKIQRMHAKQRLAICQKTMQEAKAFHKDIKDKAHKETLHV